MLIPYDNHRDSFLFQSKLVNAGPEAGPDDFFVAESAEDQEVTESINLDDKSQDALNKFYETLNTEKLSKDDAVIYQKRVNSLLRDHFLDKTEIEEIDSLVSAIKERVTPRWLRIVNGLDNPKKKNSGYFRNQIKSYCWNKSSGEISFKGSRDLENKVALPNMFDSHTLKIKINESRKSAENRKIPENAVKDGDYYVLKKSGDNYVYHTPDNINVRATVYQGDAIKEGFGISMASNEAFDVSMEHAEAEQLDSATVELSRIDVSVGDQEFSLAATDFQAMSRMEIASEFPSELGEEMDKNNLSLQEASGQNPASNLQETMKEDPGLKKLNVYLVKQFAKHEKVLREMGIDGDVGNLKPNEAVMFAQYLMKVTFKDRISPDFKKVIDADMMSIMELSKNNESVVCRNTSQIFEGYLKALRVKGMHVKTTAASTFKGKAGTPGLQKGHAWVQLSVADKNGNVGVMHLDPNWGSQDSEKTVVGKRVDYTVDRMNLTALELIKNPKLLVKTMTKNIKEFTQLIKDGKVKPTAQAMCTLQNKLGSVYALDGVNTAGLQNAVIELRVVLEADDDRYSGYTDNLETFVLVDSCINLARSDKPLFLNTDTWEREIAMVNGGTKTLFKLYSAMLNPGERDYYEENYNLPFKKVKQYLQNLWNKINFVDSELFSNNKNYQDCYARLKKLKFPIPEVKYASRTGEEEKKAAA